MSIAEQYEQNEQYELAYEEYKKEHAARPSDLGVLERLGSVAMVLDKREEAAGYYSQIIQKDPTNTLCYEQLMDIYCDTDRYKYYIYRGDLHTVEQKLEQAINDFKKALNHTDSEKDIVMTRFTLGSLYAETGNLQKAIDELLKASEYEEATPEVFLKLADLYLKDDVVTSAIDILEKAKERFDLPAINENLAQLYLRNKDLDKAKNVTKDELTKIRCMLEDGDLDNAIRTLNEISSQYTKNPEYFALKAQYYFETQDYDKALETVDEYSKLAPNNALVFQMRALIYENKNDEFNEHLNWGKYNLVRGNKDIAVNEFLMADRIDDSNVDLMHTLASLLEETGDKNHAMEYWERISEAEPSDKKALEKLAEFRESIGDYRTQVDYLEKLYVLDKRNALVIRQLAKGYEKIKDKESAIACYEKYLQYAPNSGDTEEIKRRLNKLNNTANSDDEGILDKIMKFFNK